MTGFGKASGLVGERRISVEVKSLNSKSLDLNFRLPSYYREKETEFRALVGESLQRGKVDLYVTIEDAETEQKVTLNEARISKYFTSLKEIGERSGATNSDYFSIAMKMPDVMETEKVVVGEEEWQELKALVIDALQGLNEFRRQEGQQLEKEFELRVGNIEHNLEKIMGLDGNRIERLRMRVEKKLEELGLGDQLDTNRLEQEMIYYIEKLDITEEHLRLKSHCTYFRDTMLKEDANGKKLAFIAQEFGREINTIGSKANDATIQHHVVQMKDELEKIKEQVLNIV